MSEKTYRGKYRGKSVIGYKSGRRGLLGFWINLNLIINIVIIAGMISAVFSFESMLGEDEGAYTWARWVLYAAIAGYIVLFIHLVVSIRKDLDDSRAQMRLFNYRSLSVIARKLLTILYTVFLCFILVDSWLSGVVGSESLIYVIGIIIIAFYVLMIGVDILKIVIRRKNYENTKKKRHLKKGRLQTMRKDLECQQILVEQKIIETRALTDSMVFRLLSIDKSRSEEAEAEPVSEDKAEIPEETLAVAADTETSRETGKETETVEVSQSEQIEVPEEKEPEPISITMEELQEIAVLPEEEPQEEEEEPQEITDELQVSFDELELFREQEEVADDTPSEAAASLKKDFADIFDFRSRTLV